MFFNQEEFNKFILLENNEQKLKEYYKKAIEGEIEFPNEETIYCFLITLYRFLSQFVFKNAKVGDFYDRNKIVKGQKMYCYIELLYIAYDYYRNNYRNIKKIDPKNEFSIYMFTELLKFNILCSRFLEAICFANEILELSPQDNTALFFKAIALESLYIEPEIKLKNELLEIYRSIELENVSFDKEIVQKKIDFYKSITEPHREKYTILTRKIIEDNSIDEMREFFWKNKLLLTPLTEIGPYVEALEERHITIRDSRVQKLLSNIYTDFEYCRAKYFGLSKQKHKNIKEMISVFLYCFSIFDKVAYFLYKYFDLDIEEKDVYANQNLFEKKLKNKKIQLLDVKNEFLYAIYHICVENSMRQSINPKYRAVNLAFEIRNILTHRTADYDIKELDAYTSLMMKNVRRLIQYLELTIILEEKRKTLKLEYLDEVKFNALFENIF